MKSVKLAYFRYMHKVLASLHRGSSFPGYLMLKQDKELLEELSKDYTIILVTGTNGKTTTTAMIYDILKECGQPVITNASGANMMSGIATLFISHYKDANKKYAVIEIDEANVPLFTEVCKAQYIVCNNIFKDQLDRYGEIYKTLDFIKRGIAKCKDMKLVLNGDEPLFGDIQGDSVNFGFGQFNSLESEDKNNIEGQFCVKCRQKYEYEYYTYHHLGKYSCECGYKRPELKYELNNLKFIDDSHLVFDVNGEALEVNSGGVYNAYNALAAYSLCLELGISKEAVAKALAKYQPKFGRAETFVYNNKEFKILLVKNPAGFNEALKVPGYSSKTKTLFFALNDNYADGKDISWIWDVDFEGTLSDDEVLVSGSRKYDMATRLVYAGCNEEKVSTIELEDFIDEIAKSDSENVYIFATYTAMIELRKLLSKKKIIGHSW